MTKGKRRQGDGPYRNAVALKTLELSDRLFALVLDKKMPSQKATEMLLDRLLDHVKEHPMSQSPASAVVSDAVGLVMTRFDPAAGKSWGPGLFLHAALVATAAAAGAGYMGDWVSSVVTASIAGLLYAESWRQDQRSNAARRIHTKARTVIRRIDDRDLDMYEAGWKAAAEAQAETARALTTEIAEIRRRVVRVAGELDVVQVEVPNSEEE